MQEVMVWVQWTRLKRFREKSHNDWYTITLRKNKKDDFGSLQQHQSSDRIGKVIQNDDINYAIESFLL